MYRTTGVVVVSLVAVTLVAIDALFDTDPVPVAGAVELTGTAPPASPPAAGFFVVPSRVVDFRESDSTGDDDSDASDFESAPPTSPPPVDDLDDSFDDLDGSDDSADDD